MALGRLWYKMNSPTQQGVGLPTCSTSPWTSRSRSSSSSLSWSASGERGVGFSTLLPLLLLESACGYKIEIYWTVIFTATKILFLPPISDKTCKTQLPKYSFRSAHTEVNRIKINAGGCLESHHIWIYYIYLSSIIRLTRQYCRCWCPWHGLRINWRILSSGRLPRKTVDSRCWSGWSFICCCCCCCGLFLQRNFSHFRIVNIWAVES